MLFTYIKANLKLKNFLIVNFIVIYFIMSHMKLLESNYIKKKS